LSKTKVFEEMQEIRRLRVLGYPRHEIMRTLNLSRHCYQDRVSRMNKIDQEYIMNRFHNEVATEVITLQERLLSDIRTCQEIATDRSIHVSYRLQALSQKMDCSIAMVRLVMEGPKALKSLKDSIISRESSLLLPAGEEQEQEEEQEKEEYVRRPGDEVF
jgi:hypothetical protein